VYRCFLKNIYNKVNEALEASGKKNLVSAMVKVSRASLRIGIDLRRKTFQADPGRVRRDSGTGC
jgi:hypothetical protein